MQRAMGISSINTYQHSLDHKTREMYPGMYVAHAPDLRIPGTLKFFHREILGVMEEFLPLQKQMFKEYPGLDWHSVSPEEQEESAAA